MADIRLRVIELENLLIASAEIIDNKDLTIDILKKDIDQHKDALIEKSIELKQTYNKLEVQNSQLMGYNSISADEYNYNRRGKRRKTSS